MLLSRRLQVRSARRVGKDDAHLKLQICDPEAGPRHETLWDAIAFRQGHRLEDLPAYVDLVYSLDENNWKGRRRLQLIVHDLQPAG
jgi:single-stranded-DNA-specific exonuclease